MTYILPHTNGGWAHAKRAVGQCRTPARYRLDLRANINHNISTKAWYNTERRICDPTIYGGIIVNAVNTRTG